MMPWLARLRGWARSRYADRVRVRPTRDGVWFVLLVLGVVAAAINTGNNLLYLVLGTLLSSLILSNVLAEWNLRGLSVRRRLPAEIYVGVPAPGGFVLCNHRRIGPAVSIRIEELDGGKARGAVAWLGTGEEVEAPARWTLHLRGRANLGRVRVWSTFPFGLVKRYRDLDLPAELLVYPAPAPGIAAALAQGAGTGHPQPRRAGRSHDMAGLREYEPGDPIRDLHWPTTARVGKPMVVVRSADVADVALVEVEEARGALWEQSLSRACGQLLHHFGRRHAVGLRLTGDVFPPRTGEAWRRSLLARLALAEHRYGGKS